VIPAAYLLVYRKYDQSLPSEDTVRAE